MYTLYLKVHNKTGYRYLGQTSVPDPHKYLGSGVDWKSHIKMNGNDVTTTILLITSDVEERNWWGRYYSNLWRVTTAVDDYGNRIWANRIKETGGGGWEYINKNGLGGFSGRTHKEESKKKMGREYSESEKQYLRHLFVGTKSVRSDRRIHTFYNKITSETVRMTQYDFKIHSTLKSSTISNLIYGIRKSYKGWVCLTILPDSEKILPTDFTKTLDKNSMV